MNKNNNPRVVYLATHNNHKLEEFQYIAGKEWQILPISSLNQEITWEETGDTFEKNALIKAKAIREYTKNCVIADDSGLEVYALNGEPGVYSSRYSGDEGNDKKNNEKLISELKKLNNSDRSAAFICCLVFINEEGEQQTFLGKCKGSIGFEEHGSEGFGYDPLFIPEGLQQTLAQLGPETKNQISHRKKAIQAWLQKGTPYKGDTLKYLKGDM